MDQKNIQAHATTFSHFRGWMLCGDPRLTVRLSRWRAVHGRGTSARENGSGRSIARNGVFKQSLPRLFDLCCWKRTLGKSPTWHGVLSDLLVIHRDNGNYLGTLPKESRDHAIPIPAGYSGYAPLPHPHLLRCNPLFCRLDPDGMCLYRILFSVCRNTQSSSVCSNAAASGKSFFLLLV